MQQQAIVEESYVSTIQEPVSPTHESIDLPIQNSSSIVPVGEGLHQRDQIEQRNNQRSADERECIAVDSEDLPDDEDDYESDDEDNVGDSAFNLIDDSVQMDEAVINILDDPMALSMTLKKQYENV